jgi:hypothetical protein
MRAYEDVRERKEGLYGITAFQAYSYIYGYASASESTLVWRKYRGDIILVTDGLVNICSIQVTPLFRSNRKNIMYIERY